MGVFEQGGLAPKLYLCGRELALPHPRSCTRQTEHFIGFSHKIQENSA